MSNDPTTSDLRTEVGGAWHVFLRHYEPLRPDLYRYCRYLSRSPWDAEDLVQDTLARAFATLGALLDPPKSPRAWLFRIASNLWIDLVRRRKIAGEPEAVSPEDVPAPSADDRATREAAGTLIARLSPQERAAIVLKDVFEMPLEDIAATLTTTEGAVKAALHRGRGKLIEPSRDEERVAVPRALDAFCRAFNARDLDALTALLLDDVTAEVVGASTLYRVETARSTVLPGMMYGSSYMALEAHGGRCEGIDRRFAQDVLPAPARMELRAHRGEVLMLSWYQHTDGEFVRAITRAELSGDRIARLRNYFYTPEIIQEICAELGVPCRSNGTYRARVE